MSLLWHWLSLTSFVSISVNELQEEGKNAIESPTSPTLPDIGPEGYQLGKECTQNFCYELYCVYVIDM